MQKSFDPNKMPKTELPDMMLFTVNCVATTLLKPNTRTMLTCWENGLTTEHGVIKLKLPKPPPNGIEKNQ